jgi:hypothetical protein
MSFVFLSAPRDTKYGHKQETNLLPTMHIAFPKVKKQLAKRLNVERKPIKIGSLEFTLSCVCVLRATILYKNCERMQLLALLRFQRREPYFY